jgi:hypothetical protein
VKTDSKQGQSGGTSLGAPWALGTPVPRLPLHLGHALPYLVSSNLLQTVH